MKNDYSDVAFVIYDYLDSQFNDIRANLTDLVRFKTHHPRINSPVFETAEISATLKELAEKKFSWAVVVAPGTWINQTSVFIDTVKHGEESGSALVGHLLEKAGYFHFHPQWFAVNLIAWADVGCPLFEEEPGPQEYVVALSRSPDNVHDDYTPWWLKPANDDKNYYTNHGYFGSRVITALLNNYYSITNVPQEVRNEKNYAYPEFNHDRLVEMIADPTVEPLRTPAELGLWYFNCTLQEADRKLKLGYYVLNTENFASNLNIDNTPMDCFIGVCGGLKPAVIAGNKNFADHSTVYLFDISQAALDWQQFLIDNWDGDFEKFETVFDQFQSQHPDYLPSYHNSFTLLNNAGWFLNSCNLTAKEFQQRWQRYRQMTFNYVSLDILSSTAVDQILSYSDQSTGAYLWTSNCFYMDYLMFYKSQAGAYKMQQEFIDQLRTRTKKLIALENCGWIELLSANV
jgi:hypothetical protein